MARGWKITLIGLVSLAVLAAGFAAFQLLRPVPDATLAVDSGADDDYTFPGDEPDLDWPEEGQAAVGLVDDGLVDSYGEQQPAPIASVAKVMTAYLVLRDHGDAADWPVEVDAEAARDAEQAATNGESVVWVNAGDTLDQEQALQALLIGSGNNIARFLARWDAGSEQEFVDKMNQAADELGMADTTYTDPSGLAEDTVSTAVDQVRLARAAMQLDTFREVTSQPSYVHSDGTTYETWNSLLGEDGVIGIKTGTTTPAGGNLLFAAEQSAVGRDRLVVGAVFGQHQEPRHDTVLTETSDLLDSAWPMLQRRTVAAADTTVGSVTDSLGNHIPVVVESDADAFGWAGRAVSVEIDTDDLPTSAPAGTAVGEVTVGKESTPLVLARPLQEPGLSDLLTRGF